MLRWKLAGVVATLALLVGGGAAMRVGASVIESRPQTHPPHVFELFYTAPVLVRAGERVTIPVDVVCATAEGRACASTSSIRVTAGGRTTSATSSFAKGLEFDVTGPARRALGSLPSARVDFVLSATSGRRTVRLPSRAGSVLSFYVPRSMPVVNVPAVPFGRVRSGRTVLFAPWGSGPDRVGLSPGMESATLGPSSFDVAGRGRIYVADALQNRVAVFQHGRLIDEMPIQFDDRALIAVADNGSAFVLDRSEEAMSVREVSPNGGVGPSVSLGEGIPSQIRVLDGKAYANVLPVDAWVEAGSGMVQPGMQLSGRRQLIRVGREHSIRLGVVSGNRVTDAVELRSPVNLGAVNLTEPGVAGGYLVVAHTWREGADAADQYQVIQVGADRSVRTFAVASGDFADAPPLARFRLGPDGALYQMTSSPDGIRIVRYDLEEEAR